MVVALFTDKTTTSYTSYIENTIMYHLMYPCVTQELLCLHYHKTNYYGSTISLYDS